MVPGARRTRCVWCAARLPKRRRHWCSDGCVASYKLAKNDDYRAYVWERDQGKCATCGTDAARLEKRVRRILRRLGGRAYWARASRGEVKRLASAHRLMRILQRLRDQGWPVTATFRVQKSFWEADHIQPRADGGDNRPSNLRCLCVPCHKRVTAEYAAERARRRREAECGKS